MTRQRVGLRPPPADPKALASFPRTDELTTVLEVLGPDRAQGMVTTEALDQKRLPAGSPRRLDDPLLVERLWRECRIRVVDRPRRDQLPVRD